MESEKKKGGNKCHGNKLGKGLGVQSAHGGVILYQLVKETP